MSDSYTQVTHSSWFSRIGQSLAGTLMGLLLFLAAFAVLFINEGRAVKTHKSLQEGLSVVISVDNARPDSANEGKLIHVTGKADTQDRLKDPVLNVEVTAIKLERTVEMLQWYEHQKSVTTKKLGGGTETETTFRYTKEWSESLINSSNFQQTDYQNLDTMAIVSEKWQADNVAVGGFRLTDSQVNRINRFEKVTLTDENKLKKKITGESRLEGGYLYLGSGSHDEIGDFRIKMQVVYPADISIVAGQSGNGFMPYKTEVGKTISLLSEGIKPVDEMFSAAEAANTTLTWGLRVAGLMMMFFGLKLMVRVLSVLADVVPLFGTIVGGGTSIISFLIAVMFSLVTIAVAWVFYRPLIGVALLAAALVVFWLAKNKAKTVVSSLETSP